MATIRQFWLFRIAALAGIWLLTEALSFAAFPVFTSERFSPTRLDGLRQILTDAVITARKADPKDGFLAEDALHPYLGFTGDPQADAGFSNLGLWGPLGWPPPRRDTHKLLVGITGGSFAAGVYTDAESVLREDLEKVPKYAGREIVILNLAHGGWKQPQQLLTLNWLLSLGGELDVLIDIDGFNEVALDLPENAQRGVFPGYPRGWAMRVDDFMDPDQISRLGAVSLWRHIRAVCAQVSSVRPLRWSPATSLVWQLLDGRFAVREQRAQMALSQSRSMQDRFRQTGPATTLTIEQRWDLLVSIWQRSSIQLSRLAAANGIEYFQFLQPNQYDAGGKPMSDDERRVAVNPQHPYRQGAESGYPRLRAAGALLQREGVAFSDLSRIFRTVDTALYSDDCCHLTTDGYQRFASAVVARIAEAASARRR